MSVATVADMDACTVIRTFDELRAALNRRKIDLGLKNLEIDDIAGLQSGYTGKLLCGMKRPGDMSLPAILGALKCELVLVPAKTSKQRKDDDITIACTKNLKKLLSDRAAKGGRARRDNLTAEKRRQIAQKAAKTRWARAREKKRLVEAATAATPKAVRHARTVADASSEP